MQEQNVDQDIIDVLFNEGAPEAIELLLSMYEDPFESAETIYNRWKKIRRRIINDRDNQYINVHYDDAIQHIMVLSKMHDPTLFDYGLLRNLLLSSTAEKHNISNNTKSSIFKSKEIYEMFKSVKPLHPNFYEFHLPEELQILKDQAVDEKKILKQKHLRSRSNVFEINEATLREWKNIALEIVSDEKSYTFRNLGHVIASLQLLCGRRTHEILNCMTIVSSGPTTHSAKIKNLAKQLRGLESDEILVIPLLCHFETFKLAIEKIRNLEPEAGAVRPYLVTKISKATEDLFGRRLDHTTKRNVYCELCWLYRSLHNCYTTYSKKAFFATILGHQYHFDTTDQYSSLEVTYT